MLALPPAIVAGELVRLQTRQHVVAFTPYGSRNGPTLRMVKRLGYTSVRALLPAVIRLVRARGYRFVTLAGSRAPR